MNADPYIYSLYGARAPWMVCLLVNKIIHSSLGLSKTLSPQHDGTQPKSGGKKDL